MKPITAMSPIALDEAPEVKPRLKFEQRDLLLTYLMRSPTLFLDARQALKPEHFNGGAEETALAVLWQIQNKLYEKYGNMPAGPILEAEVMAVLDADPDRYTPEMKVDVASLIETASNFEAEVLNSNPTYGRELLCNFLLERAVMDPMTAFVKNIGRNVLMNPDRELMRLTNMVGQVNVLRNNTASGLLPEGWRPQTQVQVPLGIDWMDTALDGGQTVGQVYGIFGPFGSFKTGICVQIAVAAAQTQYALAQANQGYKPRLSVYIVYEGGEDPIRLRALGCAAKIPRKRLLHHFLGTGSLSTGPDNLQDYERERYSDLAPNLIVPEIRRLDDAKTRTSNFQILDMSGPAKNPQAGSGYIPEIVAALEKLRTQTGQEIGTVVIDYAKLMARRHLQARGLPYDHMRHIVGPIPDLVRRDVCERFGCTAWIAQQLNTAANKKAAGTPQHHADSSEAGDFGENLWYAFTLSAVDKRNGNSLQFNATKTRDSEGMAEPIILRIDGTQECLIRGDDLYRRDTNGRLASRSVADTMIGPDADPAAAVDGLPEGGRPRQPRRPGQVGYQRPASAG
jgi:hypothetical protein